MARDALAIIGATATGKTTVAVAVAQQLDGEVISMDSRQVYVGMDIGTAKPTMTERDGVPHHGFDIARPDERFSAGRFAALARDWIKAIHSRHHVPVLAGGTGFFLRSLTHPMFDEPPLDARLKESWKRYLAAVPTAELARWASSLDPAAPVRAADRQRLARVIEVAVLTGRPLSAWQRSAAAGLPPIDPLVFVLELPRDVLYGRIEARVDAMIQAGLVDEVRRLIDSGYDEGSPGMNATGYIELIPHVRGERSLDEAVDMIKAATRRYARRQVTWLRHQLPPDVIRIDATVPVADMAERIVREWRREMM